jgi:phosphatidylserine decarboxylase
MKNPALYNRATKKIEYENTIKVNGLYFLYSNFLGKALTYSLLNKKLISVLYGKYVKSKRSLKNIPAFIEHYNIDIEEIKHPIESFLSFNDFFIRELKQNARPIDPNAENLISPADSRLFVFDLSKKESLPVKGYWYSLNDLLKDETLEKEYNNGWCFVYRLAPADYHRFCYIDNGSHKEIRRIPGVLHSVHPIALSVTKSLMAKNYRELTILDTENFGKVLHLEVGALLVGKIVQRTRDAYTFSRGEEKGWFEFGGSTIIQIFSREAIIPDAEILEQSAQHIETLVKIGEKVGVIIKL